MKRILTALLILSAAGLPGSVRARTADAKKSAFPVTVVDDHHNHVRISRQPARIITLFPGQTEMLFALGLGKRIVADGSKYAEGASGIVDSKGAPRAFRHPTEWPSPLGRDYPIRAPQLPHVEGGCCGTNFNLETMVSVHPDLIFAPYTKTEEPTYTKMRELGLKVILLDPTNLHAILHDIDIVGQATGANSRAKSLHYFLTRQLNMIRKRVHTLGKGQPRVYYEIDATNPTAPFTAGPGTFIDDAIRNVRGKNVSDAVTTCSGTLCYPQLSLEALVKLNPQVILLGDANYGITAASVKARTGWETISAVKSGKIHPFNDDLISRAGPRVMIGVSQLARDVHPEAFRRR